MKIKDWDGIQTNVVINAPMEEVMEKIQVQPTMIVTSPPYGVGSIPQKRGTADKQQKTIDMQYDSVEDSFSDTQYEQWLEMCVTLAPLVFWNVPVKQHRPFGVTQMGRAEPLSPFGQVIWTKAMGTIPFASKGVIYAHEYVWILGDQKKLVKAPYSVWNLPAQRYSKHPAPFPPQLAAKAIHHGSRPGDLIFDPFGGSGTTAATAKAMGRQYITCDVSPEYCGWIEERISKTKVSKQFEGELGG